MNILAIGAHPDDVEFYRAGTMASSHGPTPVATKALTSAEVQEFSARVCLVPRCF